MLPGKAVASAWGWWRSEAKKLAAGWRNNHAGHRAGSTRSHDSARISIGADGYRLATNIASETQAQSSILDLSELAEKLARFGKKPITVELQHGQYLVRKLIEANLPDYQVAEMAELDIATATPFKVGSIHRFVGGADGYANSYVLVRRDILDPVLDLIRKNRLRLKQIILIDSNDSAAASVARVEGLGVPVHRPWKWPLRMAACACALLVLTIGHLFWRQGAALDELDRQIASAQSRVAEIRKSVEAENRQVARADAVRTVFQDSVRPTQLWAELSERLPDSIWLERMQVSGEGVTAGGFAVSAAEVLPLLGKSELIRNAGFAAPVISVQNEGLERFVIRADLAGTGKEPAQ